MNAVDISICILAVLGGFLGWRKGFSVSASYFAGSFLASWAGSNYYQMPSKILKGLIKSPVIGYLLVFVAVFAAAVAAGIILNKLFKIVFLGWADSIAGSLAGAVFGLCVSAALLIPLKTLKIPAVKNAVNESQIASAVIASSNSALKIFPPKRLKFYDIEIQNTIRPVLKKLHKI